MSVLVRAAVLDANDWNLLRRALITAGYVRVALWTVPWRRLAVAVDPIPATGHRPTPDRLEWAVRVASRALPCATCLTQALALQRLLARHGYRSLVQVGVCRVDGRFLAHAWVECDGRSLLRTSGDLARYSRFFAWPESRRDH